MKDALKTFVVSICLLLVAATSVILFSPVTALAATCTVTCGGGKELTCTGTSCGIINDNGRKSCWGSSTGLKECPTEEEIE